MCRDFARGYEANTGSVLCTSESGRTLLDPRVLAVGSGVIHRVALERPDAGEAPLLQHPLLKVLEGGHDTEPIAGRAVLVEVVTLLEERLPLLIASDPCLPHLRDLHCLLAAQLLSPRHRRHG